MANRLNWSPGHNGKGNFYKSGEISTWNIDSEGNPHHKQVGDADGSAPGFLFFITPEGGINDGGVGFNNTTAMTDDQIIAVIDENDPYLWDGRADDPSENVAGPRVELQGGGYGHAYNLLNMAAVDKSNWSDCHAELKVPASVRRKIRKWVDRLKWPEGSEKDDARQYHITILSIDEYDDDFVEWMRNHIRGRSFHFKSTGMALFGPDNDIVVLRLECPEWRELAIAWGEEAEKRGLDPRRFPNGPRAHISVGRSPEGKWPQGVPDPHIEFDTAKFNINKNSMALYPNQIQQYIDQFGPYLYHGRQENPDGVLKHGIEGSWGSYWPTPSVYLTNDIGVAEHFAQNPGIEPEWHLQEEYHPESHVFKIDLRKLDPSKIEADEWNVGKPPTGVEDYYGDQFDISSEFQKYVADSDVTENALRNKTIAYRGIIPPEAIQHSHRVDSTQRTSKTSTPADELIQWLQSHDSPIEATPVSLHHDTSNQIQPQVSSPASQGHFIDPPSHPYKPYDWASEGDYNQLDRAAKVSCFECGIDHPANEPCEEKRLAIPGKDFKEAEADWYERAWKEPGRARPFPDQPLHWRDDSAQTVKQAVNRWRPV